MRDYTMRTFDVTIKNEYLYSVDDFNHVEVIRTYEILENVKVIILDQDCDGIGAKYITHSGNSNYKLNILLLSLLGIKLKFNIPDIVRKEYPKDYYQPEGVYLDIVEELQRVYEFKFSEEFYVNLEYYNKEETIKLQEIRGRKTLLGLSEKNINFTKEGKYYEYEFNGRGHYRGGGWSLTNYNYLSYNALSDVCEDILKHFCVVNITHDYGINKDSPEEDVIIKLIDTCKIHEDENIDKAMKLVKEYYQLRKNFPTLSPFDCFINLI